MAAGGIFVLPYKVQGSNNNNNDKNTEVISDDNNK